MNGARFSTKERLESILEHCRKSPLAQSSPMQSANKGETLQPWTESVRAVPNGLLRSALFGAIAKGRRRYINGAELAAVESVTIRYKGERLDQGDLDVWLSVLHAVRVQKLGSRCRLTSYALLKLMGKSDSGKNRAGLQTSIERLVANALTIRQGQQTYIGSLIGFAAKDEETREWIIELDPRLRPLFAADQFTKIQWAVRQALNGHQLAQWLHGFYSSHADPFPLKVETLHRLCGSEAGLISDFKKKLCKALHAVHMACEAHGERFSSEIAGGLVRIAKKEKAKGASQRRHSLKPMAGIRRVNG